MHFSSVFDELVRDMYCNPMHAQVGNTTKTQEELDEFVFGTLSKRFCIDKYCSVRKNPPVSRTCLRAASLTRRERVGRVTRAVCSQCRVRTTAHRWPLLNVCELAYTRRRDRKSVV